MVLVIGSFCSIYKYVRYDTFGQCFIALNFANHEVSKARSSMISFFINHDQYCLTTLYSGYSPKINLFMLFFGPLFIQNLFILLMDLDGFKKVRRFPMVDSTVPILGFRDFMISKI